LRAIREAKQLSQAEIEKRTGLLRCYISRVENGHTVPAVETLEKLARALECPLYQLLYDGEDPPVRPDNPRPRPGDGLLWGNSRKEARELRKLCRFLNRMNEDDRDLLLSMTRVIAQAKPIKAKRNSRSNR
jgi:transcriptional regulator with XRE-family HTH domain